MSVLTYNQFVGLVRSALHYLYDPDQLRRSRLAELFSVANRADTPSALQRILTDAIQSLKPDPDESPESRAWRIHDALFYLYVCKYDRDQVAQQIGVSERQLRREQRAALEVLSEYFWKKYSLGHAQTSPTSTEAPTPKSETGTGLSKDLNWLANPQHDRSTDVKQQLTVVLERVKDLTHQHKVRISESIQESLPEVSSDPVAFREILLNLLCTIFPDLSGNEILITARLADGQIEITICSSAGMANSEPSLDIAQELAHLCGGKLTLTTGSTPFQAVLTLPALGHIPVLVIDDNADAHQLLQRYASGTRYRVLGISELPAALRLIQEQSPRVIILDVLMPGIDGWDVLSLLRQDPATRNVPVVISSILPQEALVQSLGANAFLRKPVSRSDFLSVLDRLTQS